MSHLADACALIAFHGFGGATMSPSALQVLRNEPVLVSPITVWEITRKVTLGKLRQPIPAGFGGTLADFLRIAGYRIATLRWEDAAMANALPPLHADPMDRLLIATALGAGLTVITSDHSFPPYGVRTLW